MGSTPLDKLLLSAGYSDRALGRYGAVAPKTLRAWRAGISRPRREALARLAGALGLDHDTVRDAALATFAAARAAKAEP